MATNPSVLGSIGPAFLAADDESRRDVDVIGAKYLRVYVDVAVVAVEDYVNCGRGPLYETARWYLFSRWSDFAEFTSLDVDAVRERLVKMRRRKRREWRGTVESECDAADRSTRRLLAEEERRATRAPWSRRED